MECISLPEELVEQILFRVPIESVARWRSTSKQWNALLKSKRFLKTHASYAPNLLPKATTRSVLMRKTYVVLDMSSYSNPGKFHPCSINEQIEAVIMGNCPSGFTLLRTLGLLKCVPHFWKPEWKPTNTKGIKGPDFTC
ncbi:unnamed protein product [Microthlaspi erraticum]|uniref:F-box domain-containing protein n=1 Tax=Microthlaspi erraticum TaxID=1685480 RepID=A0A6D2ISS8_9BRAS|nr:unnamed protein product [Microthlaspi erraticum]